MNCTARTAHSWRNQQQTCKSRFTETQLLSGDSDSDIRANLTPYTLYRHDHSSDKFSSLGICIKNTIHIMYHKHFANLNAVKFQVAFCNNVEQQNISFVLVYRKNSSNILQFVNSGLLTKSSYN